jgi:hypothetical protein
MTVRPLPLSQAPLAGIFGKDVQSIARYEKRGRVPKMADRFLRVLYREHTDGNEKITEIIQRLNDTDQQNIKECCLAARAVNGRPRRMITHLVPIGSTFAAWLSHRRGAIPSWVEDGCDSRLPHRGVI